MDQEIGQRPPETGADGTTVDGTALVPDSQTSEMDLRFRLLADYRRRHALTHLIQRGGSVGLADVADYIISRELSVDPEQLLEERKRLYLSLYHTHVPKLAEAGFVDYDQAEDRIEATSKTAQMLPYLGCSDLQE